MITRTITQSLPKAEVLRHVKRWRFFRSSGLSIEAAQKRVGFTFDKLTRLAQPWGVTFEK
jgi:hypothetical protein